jgi:hypothetical protein
MNTWKDNWEASRQRYLRWWRQQGVILSMWEHMPKAGAPRERVAAPAPPRDLSQRWFDPAWRADELHYQLSRSSLKADILPVANTQLGPGSLAGILGAALEAGPDTIWIKHRSDFGDEVALDQDNPCYRLHRDLLTACKARAEGRYLVGMPDLMEGLDVLAALKGPEAVLMDMALRPEVVDGQLRAINALYFEVFDRLYDIINDEGEMAFCYFSIWAPGKCSKLQSDISTMFSEDDFRRFAQPYLREQCRRIPYTLYHLDGVGAMRHLDALLEIEELSAVQWTPGVGQPQGGDPCWYPLYRRILAGGKSVMANWVTLPELRPLLDNLGGNGLHLSLDFTSEAEVEQAMRIVEEYQR